MAPTLDAIRPADDAKTNAKVRTKLHGISASKRPRNPNEATASVARKLWLVAELLLRGRVSYPAYEDLHRQGYRSFQRDLQQLRGVLKTEGFEISPIQQHEYVSLKQNGGPAKKSFTGTGATSRLIASLAAAFGEPIRAELSISGGEADPFYTFAMPQLVEGTRVAELAKFFREATFSNGGRAIVAFTYCGANRAEKTRRVVEPYRVLVRSGIFYLLAYDRGRRGWRFFALDRIDGKPKRDGTASAQRTVPDDYAAPDSIGFIKGDRPRKVTVRLSPRVAASATARKWQRAQECSLFLDGSAEITFVVADETEVARWALGYGSDARVVSPPTAVNAAAALAGQIAEGYSKDGSSKPTA